MNTIILIVAYIEHFALSISALSRARLQDAEVIYPLDFLTPERLLRELLGRARSLFYLAGVKP